ncbi:MAG: NlpC/P60 family protein [Desulfotalea sp.]
MFGCAPQKRILQGNSPPSKVGLATEEDQALYELYKEYEGTRYKYGGTSKTGIDCSGFTQIILKEIYGINLGRTVDIQSKAGKAIKIVELKTGDLVFFRIKKRISHVGVYTENGNFIHASTKHGVTTSNLRNVYWRGKVVFAKRY